MKVTENNQGYNIIERFHIGAQGFVLGENPNAPQPYVTWQCRTDAPNHFFWGQYFSEKEIYEGDLESLESPLPNWSDVIAIYAAKTSLDPENPADVTVVDEENIERLKEVFYDMNKVTYRAEEETGLL